MHCSKTEPSPLALALIAVCWILAGATILPGPSLAQGASSACPTDPLAPAHTPQVFLDTRPGPGGVAAAYGGLQYHRPTGLGPREIALTFDDGPDPNVTPVVLRALRQHCLKATFFMVGWYAKAHPDLVRAVAADGHVIGSHTWLHPNNLRRLSAAAAEGQISEGMQAVQQALAGASPAEQAQLAPFFRFPGLNDSPTLTAWLGARQVAVISGDMGTDDWRGIGPMSIEWRTLRYVAHADGGIIVMHDTRPATAASLSQLITLLEMRGYRFVQIVPAPGARERAATVQAALARPAPTLASAAGAADRLDAWLQACLQQVESGADALLAEVKSLQN